MNIAQQRDATRAEFIRTATEAINAPMPPRMQRAAYKRRTLDNVGAMLALTLVSDFGYDPEEIEGRITTVTDEAVSPDGILEYRADFDLDGVSRLDGGRSLSAWTVHTEPQTLRHSLYSWGDENGESAWDISPDGYPELAAYRDSQGWRDPAEALARSCGYENANADDHINRSTFEANGAQALFMDAVASRWEIPANRVRFDTDSHDCRDRHTGKRQAEPPFGMDPEKVGPCADVYHHFVITPYSAEPHIALCAWANREDGFKPFGFWLSVCVYECEAILRESEIPDAAALRKVLANIGDYSPEKKQDDPEAE